MLTQLNMYAPYVSLQVVAFLRQSSILDVLKEKRPGLASNKSLRDKVALVRNEGNAALERLSNDVEFTMLLR